MLNGGVGCGSGPACEPLSYYIYFREVTCSEWIDQQHQWIPGDCQVWYGIVEFNVPLDTL